jgi:PEGA domain
MRSFVCLTLLVVIVVISAEGKKTEHQWLEGKVLDENRARYFTGMFNNSSSQSTENGSLSGNANSTSIGDTTNTQISGSYSGTRSTSTSGTSTPIYRVYDNLMIEGADTVYVTSERLRWRWSKSAHVAVNEPVKYYVEDRKLHILDDDGREHSVEIIKEIRKPQVATELAPLAPRRAEPAVPLPITSITQVAISIDSTPPGADIEIDGAFVGNTPSTVNVALGSHDIVVKKKGFADWTKKLNVIGGSIHLSAELESASL